MVMCQLVGLLSILFYKKTSAINNNGGFKYNQPNY